MEQWLRRILSEEAGFSSDEARLASTANCWSRDVFSLGSAMTAATTAKATRRLPGGRDWWTGQGRRWKQAVIEGKAGEAEAHIAELLAEPAPDEWDPNWPESKRSRVLIMDGAKIGDEFVVGNGEGIRGRFRVEEREGSLRAVLLNSWFSLNDEWNESKNQAEAEFSRENN